MPPQNRSGLKAIKRSTKRSTAANSLPSKFDIQLIQMTISAIELFVEIQTLQSLSVLLSQGPDSVVSLSQKSNSLCHSLEVLTANNTNGPVTRFTWKTQSQFLKFTMTKHKDNLTDQLNDQLANDRTKLWPIPLVKGLYFVYLIKLRAAGSIDWMVWCS